MQNLSSLKIDELSDEQVVNFHQQFVKGHSLDELDAEMQKRHLPSTEITKLKSRIQSLTKAQKIKETKDPDKEERMFSESRMEDETPFISLMPRIFGSELFNNPKLSFEPNLKMATPLNYQLGPDDELLIDIFGFSEQSYQLKVSPEGHIRIPNLGPVQVAGLTIEQAQNKIRTQLVKIYPRIVSGETSVSVNLGSIRSIKVTILGEVNLPGTFSLPSLATVFNALYASGGPNLNGSFRNIKLIRGNRVIAKIDMYDFLLNGSSKGNISLKDQDVIKVESYENRVELTGYVKREGFYEVLPKDNLNNLIQFAGGFAQGAYVNRIKVIRNTGTQKSVADVDKINFNSFVPKNGDQFIIDSLLKRFENRVQIEGAVFRPGYFSLEECNTLLKLIQSADGLKEDAFMTRATIIRKKEDNSLEALSVNLVDIMKGTAQVELKREDKVKIASKLEMKEEASFTIVGQVMNPGNYPFAENMHIEDLIILAGGLKESASLQNIQVAQRSYSVDKTKPNSEISKVNNFNVNKELTNDPNANYVLNPYDVVTIFPQPGYQVQKQVQVSGEVMFPGTYVLSKGNERISDLLKRAGGLTATGFPGGAILIRPKGNSYRELLVKESKLEALRKLSQDTSKAREEIERDKEKTNDVVGINLEKILAKPGSREDLFLQENDILEIPAIQQTVLVSGQVLYPVRLRYEKGNSFSKYVSMAGGFSAKALRSRAYIVYANGTAHDTKNFLFFRSYPKVKPGSEIVVPIKEDKKPVSVIEIVTISTSITSMLFILSTILR